VRTCLHELDVVTFAHPETGYGPDGGQVDVAAGTAGTIVREEPGGSWIEVEVTDRSGIPHAFVEVERDRVRMLHPLERVA
jgi:hypothetical protein